MFQNLPIQQCSRGFDIPGKNQVNGLVIAQFVFAQNSEASG
jgi:hypothetical protein